MSDLFGAAPVTKPAATDDRARGRELATELAGYARSMRAEGRVMFADKLDEAAAVMGRLAGG